MINSSLPHRPTLKQRPAGGGLTAASPDMLPEGPVEPHLMIQTLQLLVILLAVIAGVEAVANRLKVPSSILLVLTGVVLA
jgi:hypothetical protein